MVVEDKLLHELYVIRHSELLRCMNDLHLSENLQMWLIDKYTKCEVYAIVTVKAHSPGIYGPTKFEGKAHARAMLVYVTINPRQLAFSMHLIGSIVWHAQCLP